MMKHIVKPFTAVVILMMVFGTLSCGNVDKSTQLDQLKQSREIINQQIAALEKELKVTTEKPLASVSVTAFVPKPFIHEIDVQGKVESDRNVMVPAEASGAIKRIYVKEGDQVKQGQLMVQIDDEVLQAQMKEVQGNLELAKNLFDRTARLYKQQIGSEVEYLQAKNKKEGLESSLATLQAQLSKTRILSPFAGQVNKVLLKEGEAVNVGSGVIRVVHASKLKVVINLSEDYITSIHEGQEVVVKFPTINKAMNLKISNVSQVINADNRTFAVEIALPSDKSLYPNMYAVITIQDYNNDNALTIPEKNVTAYSDKFYVYVLGKNDKGKDIAEFRAVKVGKTFNNQTELLEGVKVGDQYISQGFTQLTNGEGVKVN